METSALFPHAGPALQGTVFVAAPAKIFFMGRIEIICFPLGRQRAILLSRAFTNPLGWRRLQQPGGIKREA